LGIGKGQEILVPAYNCGTEIDALLHSGATPVGYRITRQCEIDLEDLMSRKTSRTRAVYLIHYFGWEQPMEEIRRWCDEHGLLLIEDCALALFSEGPSRSIGRTGDAAIYSLPKSLGLVYGGLLSLVDVPKAGTPLLKPAGSATWFKEIRHSAKFVAARNLRGIGGYGNLVAMYRHRGCRKDDPNREFPDMPRRYYFSTEQDADRDLHPKASAILNSLSWQQVTRARRRNYQRMAELLDGVSGIKFLFPQVPPFTCPLALPLLVPNRDLFSRTLQAKGIAANPWWAGFHQRALDWSRFPDACWLKHNVLTLPIYQGMEDKDLSAIAEIVEIVEKSATADCWSPSRTAPT
jgi:dTDP-4-amino-4,6-dideoxygalactose transaminase